MKSSSMSSSSAPPPARQALIPNDDSTPAASSQSMIRSAMSAPYLERDEERALAVRWKEQQDPDALHKITSDYSTVWDLFNLASHK